MRGQRGRWLVLLLALLLVLLAACQRDKGDPKEICRRFIVSLWEGKADQVKALTCKEWQAVTATWTGQEGNTDVTIDAEHLTFAILAESGNQAEVQMAGLATFKWPDGHIETRNLDDLGAVRFFLVDEDGWKVCDVRE